MKNRADKFYDKLAESYDLLTKSGPNVWTPPKLIESEVFNLISKNSKIIDIGIGTGQAIEKVYQTRTFSSITGVDISKKMISICKEKFDGIDLIKIDSLSDLKKIKNAYDLVICSGTFEFFENAEIFFEQCHRLLNKSGYLIFTYEPIILFHLIQKDEISNNISGNSEFQVDGFFTKRYKPSTINKLLSSNKFNVLKDEEFISYKKNDSNIIYHLIVCKKI
ncbi:class I SAM-dependent methyltransferase [uncultured Algibacter sp.]|uniref:class I SAM-dependent DNA methyltransferase n=1 Tax=uncultured Algibacter sp. TaxID=298659 RepID=UPI00261C3B9A|nr:class I SAM-dependent methyltransferase [uncultured Algibacter sp.]